MKNITYLERLEKYIKENGVIIHSFVLSLDPTQEDERNELNEKSVINQAPKQPIPNVPEPNSISDSIVLEKYKQTLADWLGKFSGQTRLNEKFNMGMELQRKLTVREHQLSLDIASY